MLAAVGFCQSKRGEYVLLIREGRPVYDGIIGTLKRKIVRIMVSQGIRSAS
jgi:hypothetical protein